MAVSKWNVQRVLKHTFNTWPWHVFNMFCYRHVLLHFYYASCGKYYGCSEFKYKISPTPNPILNLPDSVNKCKSDIKMHLLMLLCILTSLHRFDLFSNRSFTGFVPELFITHVQRRIAWATKQTYWIRKLMHMKLYMWQQRSKVSVFILRRMLKLFWNHNIIFCK